MQCFRHHRHPRRPHRTHHPRNPRLATVTLALSSSARKPNMHTSRSTGPPVCSCRGKGDTEAQMYRQDAHVSRDSGRSTGGSVGTARTQSPTSRLHLTLPTQVGVVPFPMLARFTFSGNASWRSTSVPFLDARVIRYPGVHFVQVGNDTSEQREPLINILVARWQQGYLADSHQRPVFRSRDIADTSGPSHTVRATRADHARRTGREEQTQRTVGHRVIELERIGKHTRPREKPHDERAYALQHEREPHEIRQIPIVERTPTITRKI